MRCLRGVVLQTVVLILMLIVGSTAMADSGTIAGAPMDDESGSLREEA